jgi:hypothetical protein
MLEAEYLLFCESKAVDDRNRLSLISIFDTIYAQDFPAAHPQIRAVFKLTATKPVINKTIAFTMTFTRGDEEIGKFTGEFPATIEKGNSVVPDLDLSRVAFPAADDYAVKLFIDDKLIITRTIKVRSVSELTEQ